MIAHLTSLEICEISIYLPSILVFAFNLIVVSFAFVLDTLFSFFLPIIFYSPIVLATQPKAMKAIQAGMNLWSSQTCIQFVQRTAEKAYIEFFKGRGYGINR